MKKRIGKQYKCHELTFTSSSQWIEWDESSVPDSKKGKGKLATQP